MSNGRVCLVTGGGGGIGGETCRRIAGPGDIVFIHTGSKRANAEDVAADVEKKGAKAHILVADLSEPANAGGLVEAVRREVGRLDVLVHLAGRADSRLFGELDFQALQLAMNLNTYAFFHLATSALPLLRASKSARVVTVGSFVSSRFSLGTEILYPATAAAKAALTALTGALAGQLAPEGINVNCVIPGVIRKLPGQHTATAGDPSVSHRRHLERIPLGRLGEPVEVAAAIAFLVSPEASYITGACLHVDGGILA